MTQQQLLELEVAQFNEAVKIGDEVTVTKDDGSKVRTKTKSAAHILHGHSAVVMLEGISGCYLLNRVRSEA